MRVHELAKQLGKESKDVISWMKDNGIEGKTGNYVKLMSKLKAYPTIGVRIIKNIF